MTLVRSEQPVTRWRHGSLNDQLPIGAYSPRHLVDDPLVSTRRVFSSHTLTRVCAWLMERPFINSHLTPMPMTLTRPTRERNPKARKMRILVAAGVVFAKAGFAAGSVREISLKARVNVASINYYFSSKEGLYREVLLAAHRKLLEQEPPPKPTEEPEQSLREWIQFCLRFVLLRRTAHPVLGRLMAHEMRQPTAALGELVKLIIKPNFANLVKIVNALAGDSLDKDGREMAAHQIVAMCVHFDHSREVIGRLGFAVPEAEAGIARLADSIADMALRGLGTPKTTLSKKRASP